MAIPKIFAATDANIIMTIAGGFSVADISDIIVTLTRNSVSKVFKMSTGEIVVSGLDLIITVQANIITTTGAYAISVRLIDLNSKTRGITVVPDELVFE